MRTAITAIVLALTTSIAIAAPRAKADPEIAQLKLAADHAKLAARNARAEQKIAAKRLAIAKAQRAAAKAKARLDRAIEACEQAVVDRCVDNAKPDGSTDCEDDALRAEFSSSCPAQRDQAER